MSLAAELGGWTTRRRESSTRALSQEVSWTRALSQPPPASLLKQAAPFFSPRLQPALTHISHSYNIVRHNSFSHKSCFISSRVSILLHEPALPHIFHSYNTIRMISLLHFILIAIVVIVLLYLNLFHSCCYYHYHFIHIHTHKHTHTHTHMILPA